MSGYQNIQGAEYKERQIGWGNEADDGAFDLSGRKVFGVGFTVARADLGLAGASKVILPAVPGRQYKPIGFRLRFNGSFDNLTDFRLGSTEDSPTVIVTVAQAQAGNGAVHTEGLGTNTLGAGFMTALAAGYGVQLYYTGTAPAAGTNVEVELVFRIVA